MALVSTSVSGQAERNKLIMLQTYTNLSIYLKNKNRGFEVGSRWIIFMDTHFSPFFKIMKTL